MATLRDFWWVFILASASVSSGEAIAAEISDDSITKEVLKVLAEHPDLGTEINVRTVKGKVYLSGEVGTGFSRDNAENLARMVVGVKAVVDNIGISK